jgi:outer membrane protein, heavy metal efflux system
MQYRVKISLMLIKKCQKLTFPFFRFIFTFLIIFDVNALQSECDEHSTNSCEQKILDFDTAVSRALNQSLSLHMADDEIQGRKGLKKQARLYPNPEFSYNLENPGDVRSGKGWSSREEIFALTQPVEWRGKRSQRIKAASHQYYAAMTGYQIAKLNLLNRLNRAFIRVVETQELIKIAIEQQEIAKEVLRVTNEKLKAGKVSIIQQSKAEVSQSLAELNEQKVWADFKSAKNSLALLWSSPYPDFDYAIYPFYAITPPLPLEECLGDLCNQPEVLRSLHEYSATYHNFMLEKSARIPDVSLTLGYINEAGDKGLVAGIAFPLPIWDQNQGNIKQAYFEMLKTGKEGKQLWIYLETKLSNSYLELVRAYQAAETLKNTVLKSATQAFELAQQGYREGKFEFLDVLDAQRTLFEIQERYIQALANYHHRRANIDYLNSLTD